MSEEQRKHTKGFEVPYAYISVETTDHPPMQKVRPIFVDISTSETSFASWISQEQAEFLALALLAELKDQGYPLGGGNAP